MTPASGIAAVAPSSRGGAGQRLPLARSLAPAPGESFTSYIDRQAALHHVTLSEMLWALGIIDEPRASLIPKGYGVYLSRERTTEMARLARIPEEHVRKLLLTAYGGICLNLEGMGAENGASLQRIARREWAYFSGSNICPECLAESGGVWHNAWKLPWVFACTRHKTLMRSTCPSCGLPPASFRRDRITKPHYGSVIPVPGTCYNTVPRSGRGNRGAVCGSNLTRIRSDSLAAFPVPLEAQEEINGVLSGAEGRIAGIRVPPTTYFAALKGLASLLLYAGSMERLGDFDLSALPDSALGAFRRFEVDRERKRSSSETEITQGRRSGRGPRIKVASQTPQDPELRLALFVIAKWYMGAGSIEEMAGRLKALVLAGIGAARNKNRLGHYFNLPVIVQRAVDSVEPTKRTFATRFAVADAISPAQGPLTADQIPQLLWASEYARRFKPYFGPLAIREESARRALSIMLVKAATREPYANIATQLGLPARQTVGMMNKVMGLVRNASWEERFTAELRELAQSVAADPCPTNFGRLRSAMAGFDDIPWGEWRRICRAAGIQPGERGGRSAFAAAWVWARVTEGDWRLSPTMDDATSGRRDSYQRFLRTAFPALEPHLENLAKELRQQVDRDLVASDDVVIHGPEGGSIAQAIRDRAWNLGT